jgi:hypothetical protein
MASRTAHDSTVKRLSAAKKHFGSLDSVMTQFAFGVSKGTLSRALNGGPVSVYAENNIREALGLEAVKTCVVEACPSCSGAHGEKLDCHGKPVAQVVILTDNERVVSRGKPRNRKRYHRPCMDDETYAEYLQWRKNLSDV